MQIGIDIRPLQDPVARGVSSYAQPLIKELIRQKGADAFRFFAAGRTNGDMTPYLDQLGIRGHVPVIKHLRLPSRVVNAGMRFLGSPTIDGQLETRNVFMPNLGFWSVGTDARLTVTVHDLSFLLDPTWYSWHGRAWHQAINVKGLLRRADSIITLSAHTKREIIDLLDIDEHKIHHIPPGIPEIISSSRVPRSNPQGITASLPAPRDDAPDFPYILFIGVLEKRKNIVGALRAFELAANRIPNTHFVLAGPRSMDNGQWTMDNSDRIHFLGQVSAEKKSTLLRHATALFLPSFHEGFGFPPLEAMSVGVPVVASTAGALPETIGNAGLLLDPMDIGGFADALVEICENDRLRTKLIARGHEQIKPFSWQRCAAATWDVISTPFA